MKVCDHGVGICEEFTDLVLFDKTRSSIVVNSNIKFFKTIKKEMSKLNYQIVFTKTFKDLDTITCVFKKGDK